MPGVTRSEAKGSCLCGAVQYRLHGPLRPVVGCHCTQCRKTSGHFVAATAVAMSGLQFTVNSGLRWYRSSEHARRGFCAVCGSSLFWQRDGDDRISVMAGTLDGPTGLTMALHIFCADAGDYYRIPGDAPHCAGNGELPQD